MKIAMNVLGALLIVAGSIWFLQGINILPGSYMTGQTKWVVYGGIALLAGIGLTMAARRQRRG